MPSATLPPFPNDVPTHPLLVVDYALIQANDQIEIDKLWKAATEIGFWYLKNHQVDPNDMFDMGVETMNMPTSEKVKFEQGDGGMSHGYKAIGANAVDETGALDTVEYINIAKDDAFAYPKIARRSYPAATNARMESTIAPFIRKSTEVNMVLIEVFNDRLGLPKGTLAQRHLPEELSGSEARCTKTPPKPQGMSEELRAIGAHSDFGSMSFLHNRLGGLQVLVPGTEKWQYIKPIPGHAICNVGDAMALFSGGILRSNIHRVVTPPGDQAKHERWSLVFFTRPGDSVVLRALIEDSPLIAAAVKNSEDPAKYETGSTSFEWFARRTKNQRIKNRTGPETWQASRGTEHQPAAS